VRFNLRNARNEPDNRTDRRETKPGLEQATEAAEATNDRVNAKDQALSWDVSGLISIFCLENYV